jgi:hypothetical protein
VPGLKLLTNCCTRRAKRARLSNVVRYPMALSVSQAFELFQEVAEAAGLPTTLESHARTFGSRVMRANSPFAELRLVWDGKEGYLSLEVDHGCEAGKRAGWVGLFAESCPNERLPDPRK